LLDLFIQNWVRLVPLGPGSTVPKETKICDREGFFHPISFSNIELPILASEKQFGAIV